MPDLYVLSDKTVDALDRLAIRRFREARTECAAGLTPFDELTVIRVVRTLYDAVDRDNREAFLALAKRVYERTEPHGATPPDRDWMDGFLLEYSPVTKYVYAHEVGRKRDYTAEAVIAAGDKSGEFRRGLLHWSRFTATYADLVTGAATLKAFSDAGIRRVRWRTEGDEKVCDICHKRNGKIYDIRDIPEKPHIRCRCWYEPVE